MRGLFLFSFSALDYGQLPAEPARNYETQQRDHCALTLGDSFG
jgi:hypothetical protein